VVLVVGDAHLLELLPAAAVTSCAARFLLLLLHLRHQQI
jgi:hypothetical protein